MKRLLMLLSGLTVLTVSPVWAQNDSTVYDRLVGAWDQSTPGATLTLHGKSSSGGIATYELKQGDSVERGTWISLKATLEGNESMYVLTPNRGEARYVFQSTRYTLEVLDSNERFVRSSMGYEIRPAS
ncbi:hypothetical protein [Alcanivorax sp. 24]|uniref:hypothetical protein n=1 Tax=Alcanivorax sp. 24 TaxID=2545266 RepID=UPI00105CD3AA|nr:hypothetical protein [Alcanivorax sp. 24]